MGGPRVTSGEDSKQDYSTPDDFLRAVVGRFGPISFDLAAHKLNKKHERYLAPTHFLENYDPDDKKLTVEKIVASLVRRGAVAEEAIPLVEEAARKGEKTKLWVPNRDPGAYALDAFKHSWAELSRKFPQPSGAPGNNWLNCEFSDVAPWAERSASEAKEGASTLLLTPAAVGSNWWRDHVAGVADCHILNGRLCFDGKNVFPKDCCLSHFHPNASGDLFVWDWRRDKIYRRWRYVS